jgi:hypothetical protein
LFQKSSGKSYLSCLSYFWMLYFSSSFVYVLCKGTLE